MDKLSRLAELRRLRASGKTKRDLRFDEEEAKIYDEYAESEYEKRQRERLREDDFVVDDDGKGYVDNGEYEWDQEQNLSEEEDEIDGSGSSSHKKRGRKTPQDKAKDSQNKDIVSLFRTQKKPRLAASTPLMPKADVEAIVNGLGSNRTPASSKSGNTSLNTSRLGSGLGSKLGSSGLGRLGSGLGNRLGSGSRLGSSLGSRSSVNRTRGLDTPTKSMGSPREPVSSEGDGSMIGSRLISSHSDPVEEEMNGYNKRLTEDQVTENQEAEKHSSIKDEEALFTTEMPSSEAASFSMTPVSLTTVPESDSESDDELIAMILNRKSQSQQSTAEPELLGSSMPDLPTSDPPMPLLQDSSSEEAGTPSNLSSDEGAITGSYASTAWNLVSDEPDVNVNMSTASTNDSTTPETFRFYWTDYLEMQGGLILFGKSETGVGCTVLVYGINRDVYVLPKPEYSTDDVSMELSEFFSQNGVQSMRSRNVKLRDVFAKDKSEKEYLHVKAPYSVTQPIPEEGTSYQAVYGANSSRIENFLVGKNIMGPCWLDVKVQKVSNNTTWSGLAYECASPAHIKATTESQIPRFTLMSIAVTTIPNAKQEHELVSISLRIFRNVDIGTHDATVLPSTLITGIRPPASSGVFPLGFKQAINDHNAARGANSSKGARQVLEMFSNEQKLLGWFFDILKTTDPDVLIGHNLTNIHLATILDRSLTLSPANWSQLGRFKISRKPTSVKTHEVQRVCSGRLLVDLKNTFGEEIASGKCTDFSLEEMCRVFLGQQRLPFDTNLTSGDWLQQGSSGLLEIVRRSEYDTLFVASIAMKNQMLPLSRQLTCLAGNPWRATLAGTRSGRNDYLLMHEFSKNGFLIPEKRKTNQVDKSPTSYTGGHVFDPITGLHQSCVLVMDFNSLYPSIIQEYNICLTTIDFERNQSDSPELPPSTVPQGLLPRILQNLVERRREVKNLMKSDTADTAQMAEWNIRQTALKLTANSMYGCLGFSDSRFCAKPLAQLITQKGREALLRTRDLAIEKGLEVLYGDTDSVMINTNAVTYADAYAIGVDFKRAVNKQYQLMEIDIDHVFRKLLLYVKKKYAAVIIAPDGKLTLEYKGLDMRRREFCDVCKISSRHVLELIFGLDAATTKETAAAVEAGEAAAANEIADPLEIFSKVYQYLHEYATKIRQGKVFPKMFIMRNQLGKELNQYPTLDKPQLVVADARLKAGHSVRAKDVISYIITMDMNNENKPLAQRAVAPEELKKNGLIPDYEWYIHHQIFIPINRFCEKIDGFDSIQLAEAMQLQKTEELRQAMKRSEASKSNLYDGLALVTVLQDEQRFGACEKLELEHAGHKFEFTGVSQLQPQGIVEPQTGSTMPYSEVAQQVENAIRKYISHYYEGWLVCDECKCATRLPTALSSKVCPKPHCTGTLSWSYSSNDLYTQMCYIASLFDINRAKSKTTSAIVHGRNSTGLQMVELAAQRYIRRSGYNYVNIGQYFC